MQFLKGKTIFDHLNNMKIKHSELFLYNSKSPLNSFRNSDDLYSALRYFFIFGRIIGVVPFQGLFHSTTSHSINFKWKSAAAIYSLTVCGFLAFGSLLNTLVSFKGSNGSPSDLAWSANLTVYYAIGCFTYIFVLNRAQRIINLFKKWRDLVVFYDGVDKGLMRDVNVLVVIIYTSCILEHSYAHLKFFPIVESAEKRLANRKDLLIRLQNASDWEVYYWRSHPFVGDIIPYHLVAAVTLFVMSKYCILAWNFGDILIAVMSRALYYRFKILNEQAQLILIGWNGTVSKDVTKWRQLTRDHENLCNLATEFEEILSPLIFTLFGVNIYYFCIQLNLGLTPSANTTIIASIYAVWSFLHLITRILVASITASHINVHAHRVAEILKKCPPECFTPEIDRAERIIRSSKIGLSGLGCFTITRQFILQIVNVVFTFEIVLLQNSGAPP